MHKKPLILVIFSLFLFTICSGCSKNLENCKILPKIEIKTDKKNESKGKIKDAIENRVTSAEASCNF